MIYRMNVLIYPGSFKPPHKGHLSVIKKALSNNKPKFDLIYIIISPKSRFSNNKKIEITGEQSKLIWEELIKTLPKIEQTKIKIYLTPPQMKSPIVFSQIISSEILKKKGKVWIGVSEKNSKNSRAESIKNTKLWIAPEIKNINSTLLRNLLSQKNLDPIKKFYPSNQNLLKNILKIISKK